MYDQVWDSYGRLLYQSSPLDYSVTSISWCPGGDLFAVGSYNSLQLCDRMGWSYSKVGVDSFSHKQHTSNITESVECGRVHKWI